MAERGKIMADAIPSDSGMASIYGLSSEEVDDMCKTGLASMDLYVE